MWFTSPLLQAIQMLCKLETLQDSLKATNYPVPVAWHYTECLRLVASHRTEIVRHLDTKLLQLFRNVLHRSVRVLKEQPQILREVIDLQTFFEKSMPGQKRELPVSVLCQQWVRVIAAIQDCRQCTTMTSMLGFVNSAKTELFALGKLLSGRDPVPPPIAILLEADLIGVLDHVPDLLLHIRGVLDHFHRKARRNFRYACADKPVSAKKQALADPKLLPRYLPLQVQAPEPRDQRKVEEAKENAARPPPPPPQTWTQVVIASQSDASRSCEQSPSQSNVEPKLQTVQTPPTFAASKARYSEHRRSDDHRRSDEHRDRPRAPGAWTVVARRISAAKWTKGDMARLDWNSAPDETATPETAAEAAAETAVLIETDHSATPATENVEEPMIYPVPHASCVVEQAMQAQEEGLGEQAIEVGEQQVEGQAMEHQAVQEQPAASEAEVEGQALELQAVVANQIREEKTEVPLGDASKEAEEKKEDEVAKQRQNKARLNASQQRNQKKRAIKRQKKVTESAKQAAEATESFALDVCDFLLDNQKGTEPHDTEGISSLIQASVEKWFVGSSLPSQRKNEPPDDRKEALWDHRLFSERMWVLVGNKYTSVPCNSLDAEDSLLSARLAFLKLACYDVAFREDQIRGNPHGRWAGWAHLNTSVQQLLTTNWLRSLQQSGGATDLHATVALSLLHIFLRPSKDIITSSSRIVTCPKNGCSRSCCAVSLFRRLCLLVELPPYLRGLRFSSVYGIGLGFAFDLPGLFLLFVPFLSSLSLLSFDSFLDSLFHLLVL